MVTTHQTLFPRRGVESGDETNRLVTKCGLRRLATAVFEVVETHYCVKRSGRGRKGLEIIAIIVTMVTVEGHGFWSTTY